MGCEGDVYIPTYESRMDGFHSLVYLLSGDLAASLSFTTDTHKVHQVHMKDLR